MLASIIGSEVRETLKLIPSGGKKKKYAGTLLIRQQEAIGRLAELVSQQTNIEGFSVAMLADRLVEIGNNLDAIKDVLVGDDFGEPKEPGVSS